MANSNLTSFFKAAAISMAMATLQFNLGLGQSNPKEADLCVECHDLQVKSYGKTSHATVGSCSACHGDGARHIEQGGGKDNIINPKSMNLRKANLVCTKCHEEKELGARDAFHASPAMHDRVICFECHQAHLNLLDQPLTLETFDATLGVECAKCHETNAEKLRASPHGEHGMDCKDCHVLHKQSTINSDIEDQVNRCLDCHPQQDLEFRYPFSHPLGEWQIKCSDCHDPHDNRHSPMLKEEKDRLCEDCHTDIAIEGGQHPLRLNTDHSFRSVPCLDCHEPHGSNFEFVLKHNPANLCSTCHLEVDLKKSF